jgi:hypothetical protein
VLGIDLIPSGELAGRPALTIPASPAHLDYADPRCLLHAVLQRRSPGVRYVQLVSAPWGQPGLDQAITNLEADPRTTHMVVWCERLATEPQWAAAPVWWSVDLSSLLAQPIHVSRLVDSLNSLPPLPQPAEMVVRHPHGQLAAAHLDELTTRLDCDVGWLYSQPGTPAWDACEVAVAQAVGCWGLRAG